MLRESVDPRSFSALLSELWYRFEPKERMLLLPIAPLDTLDYTSFQMHVGSKVVFDATGEKVTSEEPPREIPDLPSFDSRIAKAKLLDGGFVIVVVKSAPREVLEKLVRWEGFGSVKVVVAVSEDVDLSNEEGT